MIDGIRPKCVVSRNEALLKSERIWNAAKEADAAKSVFAKIVEEYGSRFYQEEIINATKKVKNCSFFIAPYHASAQLVQFFAEEMVHVVFGSTMLLCYEQITQAVVDFDIVQGTFTFVDRTDLKITSDDLALCMLHAGCFYGLRFGFGEQAESTNDELIKALVDSPKSLGSKAVKFVGLKHVLFLAPPILSKGR